MADVMVSGTKWNESQFQNGHMNACGVNALALAESWGSQSYLSTAALFDRMYAAGNCDSTGRATIDSIERQARADKFTTEKIGFTSSGIAEATWRHFLATHAGKAVVIVETLEGCQLRDLISGQGEDAQLTGPNRLQRHFFGIYGLNDGTSASATFGGKTLPAGYIVSDGCNGLMNPVVNGVRQRVLGPNAHQQLYYSYATVRASRPAALLAVYPKAAMPTVQSEYQTIVTLRQQIYRQNAQIAQQQTTIAQLQAVIAAVRAAVK